MFEDLIAKITEPSKLMAASPEKLALLRVQYPMVPEEYFVFLEEIGWGNIGMMMMYHGLLDPNDILEPIDEPWVNIAIFGDNFGASSFGFDLENGDLVEITPEGYVELVEKDFGKFISWYAQ